MSSLRALAGLALKRRWLVTFAFGLVHGFGFSFALRETLQFAGSHLLASLLAFNIGVELGQLLVLVLLIPALDLLFRYVVAERMGTIILSALVAHTAWHWMTERFGVLRQFRFEWPVIDPAFWVRRHASGDAGRRRRGAVLAGLRRDQPQGKQAATMPRRRRIDLMTTNTATASDVDVLRDLNGQ